MNPDVQNISDAQLAQQVELAAAGDADALQRLIVRYHPILRARLAPQVGGKFARLIDVEDVLQQAYVSAFKALPESRFSSPGGFYKWLERIATNDWLDMQRALKRQKRDVRRVANSIDTRDSLVDAVQRIAASGPTPSRQLARGEAIAAALSCLARLTEEQRTVIRRRYFEHAPVAELAHELGKSESAVHALCYRALQRLREHLGPISRYLTRL